MAKLILKSIDYYPVELTSMPEAHKVLGRIDTDLPYKKLVVAARTKQLYRLVDESTGQVLKQQKLVRDLDDLKIYVGQVIVVELKDFFSFQHALAEQTSDQPLYMVDAGETSCVAGLITPKDASTLPELYVMWEPGMSVANCLNPQAMALQPFAGLGGISGVTVSSLSGVAAAVGLSAVQAAQSSGTASVVYPKLSGSIFQGPVIGQLNNTVSGLKVQAFDSSGKSLGIADVKADGSYELTLTDAAYKGALVLKVYDDSTDTLTPKFRDEATGTEKTFTTLLAVINYQGNATTTTTTVNVTALTNLAAVKAGVTVTASGVSVPAQATTSTFESANTSVAQKFLGSNTSLFDSKVSPTVNSDGSTNTANKYGNALSLLSFVEQVSGKSTADAASMLAKSLDNTDADSNRYLSQAAAYAAKAGVTQADLNNILSSVTNNTLATGSVSISNTATNKTTPQEGDTLSFLVDTFVDANNTKTDKSFSTSSTYQWQSSSDKKSWTNIDKATNSNFSVTQDQVNTYLRVLVKNIDDKNYDEFLISDASAKVINLNQEPGGSLNISVSNNGSLQQNSILQLTDALTDTDGLGTRSYQWQSKAVNGVWSDISGARFQTYTLTQAEVDKTIRVMASYTDAMGTQEVFYGADTAAIANVNDLPQGAVMINGQDTPNQDFSQNEVLTASHNLSDPDNNGTPVTGVTYQWQNSADGNGWNKIANATSVTYTLAQSDVDKKIQVVASYTDATQVLESKASEITGAVHNVNDMPVGTVAIDGSFTENQIPKVNEKDSLTARVNLTDADNNGVAIADAAYSYQWQTSSNGSTNWTNIGGNAAKAQTFTPTNAEVDTFLRVTVSYTDTGGYSNSKSSDAVKVKNVNDALMGNVTVSGANNAAAAYTQSATLYASNTFTDDDGMDTVNYQWQNSTNGTDWNDIATASASNYTLTQSDVGKYVRVHASYTDLHGALEAEDSSSSLVSNENDPPVGTVLVDGQMKQGVILQASNTLTDADNMGTVNYQWQVSSNKKDWTDIAQATGPSFTLTQQQTGQYVRVKASYIDGGNTTETVYNDISSNTTVLDVMEAPVLSVSPSPASQVFTEATGLNQQADPKGGFFANAQLSDAEINNITSMQFSVSGLKDGTDEKLFINGTAVTLTTSQNGAELVSGVGLSVVMSGPNNSIATVTLSNANGWNLADAQSLIASVAYQNTNKDKPTPGDRSIALLQLVDNGVKTNLDDSNTANFLAANNTALIAKVTVQAVNDAPVLNGQPPATPVFNENGSAVTVNTAISISDVDTTLMKSAIIKINSGYVSGDSLNLALDANTMGDISVIPFNAATQQLVLNSSAGASTTQWQNAMRAVKFISTSDNPGTTRSIDFVVNDGTDNSLALTTTVTVTPVNDAPVLTLTANAKTFSEGAGLNLAGTAVNNIFTVATFTDAESNNIASITLTVSNVLDGSNEVLLIDGKTITLGSAVTTTALSSTNGLSYTQTWDSGNKLATIVLTKAGGVSLDIAKNIVESIGYQNTNVDNPSQGVRTISVTQITDVGSNTSPDINNSSYTNFKANITVQATNDAPVNTVPASTVSVGYNSSTYITGLGVSDADAGEANTFSVKLAVNQGTLSLSSLSGVDITGNSTNSVTLTGMVADIHTLLRTANAVQYTAPTDTGGSFTLTMTSNDAGSSGSGAGTDVVSTVSITVNQLPVLSAPANKIAIATEDTEIEITADMLKTNTSATDAEDRTVNAFVVKSIASGTTVRIGTRSDLATDWIENTNAVVDGTRKLYWKAAQNANGTGLSAFSVAAKDNVGAESLNAVPITLDVTAVNDAPKFTNSPAAAPVSSNMNTEYALPTGYSVDDVDAGNSANLKLSFTLKEGANVSGSLAYTEGTSGVNWVSTTGNVYTFSGSLSQFNTWMSTPNFLRYIPSTGFTGDATVVMAINDSGARGSGSAINTIATNALTINVKDVTAPLLQSVSTSSDGSKIILTYNEALSATTAANTNFTYKLNNGTSYTPNSVTVNGRTIELNLIANKPASGDAILVNYTAPTPDTSSTNLAVQDSSGNDAVAIANNNSVTSTNSVTNIAPTLSTTPVTNLIPNNAFTVNGSTSNVSAVNVNGRTVELTLDASVNIASAITLAYANTNTSKAIQDTTGNDAAGIATALTIPVAGYTAPSETLVPTLISATLSADRKTVILTYSESLDTTKPLVPGNFTVFAGADYTVSSPTSYAVSSAVVNASNPNTVVLTLSAASVIPATLPFVTVSNAQGSVVAGLGNSVVQDTTGNDAASFSRLLVPTTNIDSVLPVLRTVAVSSSGGVNKLIMTYSEALNNASNFTEGSGSAAQGTAVFVFSSATVNAGAGETTQNIAGLSFTVSGLKDGTDEKITVDGTTFTLTNGNAGTTSSIAPNNAMSYTVAVSGSTATVTLTKAGGITAAQAQSLLTGITYQNTNIDNPTPGLRVFDIASITDSSGATNATSTFAAGINSSSVLVTALNDAPTFTSSTVASVSVPTTNSQAASKAINIPMNGFVMQDKDGGNTIESLSFYMTDLGSATPTYAPLNLNFPVGATSLYATKVSDNTYYVYGTVADLNYWLQQTNAISYNPRFVFAPGGATPLTAKLSTLRIRDTFGAYADSTGTTNIPVTADTQAPSLRSAVLSSEANNKIILNFDEPLNTTAANWPLSSAFSIAGMPATVSSVIGSSVILTTSSAVSSGVAVTYTDNAGAAAIQDAAGVHATTQTMTAISDVSAPALTGSMVYYNGNGSALNKFVLNFSEDISSVCATPGQFSVSISDPVYPDRTGTASVISSTVLSGGASSYGNNSVTFGINTNFLSPNASVSVTYTDNTTGNDGSAIQDVAGNDVGNMVLGAWTNDNLVAVNSYQINGVGTPQNTFIAGKTVLVVGGQGNDTMTGGLANDTFTWFAGDAGATGAVDVVKSFVPVVSGVGDKLDISKLLTGYAGGTNLSQWVTSVTTAQTSPAGMTGSTKIVIDTDGPGSTGAIQTIWLEGVNLTLTGANLDAQLAALKTSGVLIA